jgi:hypothetical protein
MTENQFGIKGGNDAEHGIQNGSTWWAMPTLRTSCLLS